MNPEHPSAWQPTEASQSPAPPRQSSPPSRRGGLATTVVGVALFGALIGVAADRWAVSSFTQNPLGSVGPTITTGPRIGPVAAPNGGGTTAQAASTEQSRDRNVYTLIQQNGSWVISADDHPDDNLSGSAPGASQPGVPGSTTPGQGSANPSGRSGRGAGNPGTGTGVGNPGEGTGGNPGSGTQPGQGVSQNWSGYAATGGTYTGVSGTWTVPQFAPSSPAGA